MQANVNTRGRVSLFLSLRLTPVSCVTCPTFRLLKLKRDGCGIVQMHMQKNKQPALSPSNHLYLNISWFSTCLGDMYMYIYIYIYICHQDLAFPIVFIDIILQ